VAVLDLATGTTTILVPGGSHAHYVSSGHLVYVAGSTLRAVPFDLDELKTRGTSVAVVPRLVTSRQGSGDFVVSSDGTLVYVDGPDATAAERTLVWVDRNGREDPLGTPPRPYFTPSLSPAGTRVAVAIADQDQDIWIWDIARRALSRLTFTPSPTSERTPVWTADGNRLIFFTPGAPAGLTMFWKAADGSGTAEELGSGPPSGLTPDGRVLFGAQDLTTVTLDGTRRMQELLKTPFSERNGVVSPDGRWLAYESNSSGRFETYVAPFPNATTRQWLVSAGGGTRPLWARSGQELFYVAPDGAVMGVRVDPRGDTWGASNPVKVVEGPYVTLGGTALTYGVSPDGQRFLMVKQAPAAQTSAPQIIVVQNWLEELKRLAPVR
jgi:serine/threonine-protein kinase